MTPASEELLDEALLRILEERDSRFGLRAEALAIMTRPYGHLADEEAVRRRLNYLADSEIHFVERVQPSSQFHAQVEAWRITARGMNHLRVSP
jgi:repressor of nif and glnA expression